MFEGEVLAQDTVFRVGRVVSVEGRRVRVAVDKLKNSSHLLFQGGIVRNVAVGSYLKIAKGFSELIAKVDGEVITEDRAASTVYRRGVDPMSRQLDVSLIGFIEHGRFERGVREMPLLNNECFIPTEEEFQLIHSFVDSDDEPLLIGSLAMEPTQTVAVGVDAIFASHVGIFGNTGSGKSYTLAKLYYELFQKYGSKPTFRDRSQFILIDFNGEYVNRPGQPGDYATTVIADESVKRVYELSTQNDDGDRLPLPSAAVHDQTLWSVLLDATEKTQAPFIGRALGRYWDRVLDDSTALLDTIAVLIADYTKSTDAGIDRQLPTNFLEEVQLCLGDNVSAEFVQLVEDFRDNLGLHTGNHSFYWGPYSNIVRWSSADDWADFIKGKVTAVTQDFREIGDVDLVRFRLVLQFYREVIKGFANREHLGPLMKRLDERVPNVKRLITVSDDAFAETPLTVISLRTVNLAMRKVLPMIVCKYLYDAKKESDPSGSRYLNLIIDEAHNILSTESSRETEAWRDYRLETFEEIIKEGRKFGVFLTIASQRPHDISETIISQLHNYFLHRLVNNLDIHAIEKAVAYLDRVSFESLPILPTGACVLSGVSAQVPVVVKIAELPSAFAPNSRTMSVTTEWMKPLPPPDGEDGWSSSFDPSGDDDPPF
ncbi:ATP-binding protein [Mycobacteroides salmoniphilum]|uniref:ATP-binding protein n=1 Tax=Mycobacteroides salmoniphilum TaxID=404941 RepID=UPI0010DC1095|nr:ATP-binding protein [Mycobacteroides salmoniphilum]TDZ95008.1 AAA-like domain protein [Mycobacteroides salmoniphilum]